jgi:secreted PhoX family phosphatase
MIQQIAAATASLLARGAGAAALAYGNLHPRPSENGGELLLALPDGFRYTRLSRAGVPMSDGNATPRLPDGMAAFFVNGELRLVCNHEIRDVTFPISAGPWQYDGMGGGGTTTIVVDPITRLPVRQFVSLAGTITNCAGGPTPWGSWISCEESLGGAGFTQPHGYCFEVPAAANTPVAAIPLKAMGRFVHEAAAVDPATGIVYLTEDQDSAGLYRFLPHQRGVLAAGGRLQMLAVRDATLFDATTGQIPGRRMPVAWVDIDNPDAGVFAQGRARGAARFRRLEGACFGDGCLFFTSTSGGDRGLGQIWQYRVRHKQRAVRNVAAPLDSERNGELTLLFESPAADVLQMPDNICVTPWQTLMVCEDNGGTTYLRGVTRQGAIFPFAQNIAPGLETTEFAGACFSPDGQTLFVNLQAVGATLAIWGPWITA